MERQIGPTLYIWKTITSSGIQQMTKIVSIFESHMKIQHAPIPKRHIKSRIEIINSTNIGDIPLAQNERIENY